MSGVQIVITGDPATGGVKITGPINDMRIVHWMLGEALRVCERLATEREKAQGNGKLVVVPSAALDGLVNPGGDRQ